jgi:DNA-binding LacI/PurR family transcriptional regulator
MDFVSGIESVLAERSASLLLRLVRDLDEEAAVYEEWWRGRMIAGAILADFREDDSRVPALRGLGLPAVAVGHPSLTGPFPAVWTDDASAVAEAVRYLAALGHRRIARVGGPTDLGAQRHPGAVPHSVIRARAFADTTRAPGLAEARQIATGFDEKEGARATRTLLLAAEKTRRPQAVSRVASKPVAMSRYSTPAPLPLHDQPRYPTPSCCAVDMMTFLVRIAVRVQVAEFPDDDGKTLGSEPVEVIPSRCPRC